MSSAAHATTTAAPARIRPQLISVGGLRIRYAETAGPADRTILLTSPWPESIYAYARIWTELAREARLVAVDLPGFGRSECRGDLRSPRAMGGFLVELIDGLRLGRPHLVAPDVGTAAALFAATQRPGLLVSITIDGGGAFVPLDFGSPLRRWAMDPDLHACRRNDLEAIVDGALETIADYELPHAIRQDYLASYGGFRLGASMRYVRKYPADLAVLAPLLGEIETPVQIIAGCHDGVVPVAYAQYLYDHLPCRRLELVRAGHFVWEDAPEAYAALIRDWTAGGCEAA